MQLLINTVGEMHAFNDFDQDERKKVMLVHCKAGKGRSGTLITSYMIAHQNKSAAEAMGVFTAKRMRRGFGEGVSIRSQRRYVNYMEQWVVGMQKRYVERKVRVTNVSVWGLKGDVEISVGGYTPRGHCSRGTWELGPLWHARTTGKRTNCTWHPDMDLRTADVCLSVQRWVGFGQIKICKTRAWFNAVMETAKRDGDSQSTSGRFEIPWEEMDGLKGTALKGRQAFERCVVEWEFLDEEGQGEVREPELVSEDGIMEIADDITVVGDSEGEQEKLMCVP